MPVDDSETGTPTPPPKESTSLNTSKPKTIRPVLYQYTCWGRLYLTETELAGQGRPCCDGIETKLRKVMELTEPVIPKNDEDSRTKAMKDLRKFSARHWAPVGENNGALFGSSRGRGGRRGEFTYYGLGSTSVDLVLYPAEDDGREEIDTDEGVVVSVPNTTHGISLWDSSGGTMGMAQFGDKVRKERNLKFTTEGKQFFQNWRNGHKSKESEKDDKPFSTRAFEFGGRTVGQMGEAVDLCKKGSARIYEFWRDVWGGRGR